MVSLRAQPLQGAPVRFPFLHCLQRRARACALNRLVFVTPRLCAQADGGRTEARRPTDHVEARARGPSVGRHPRVSCWRRYPTASLRTAQAVTPSGWAHPHVQVFCGHEDDFDKCFPSGCPTLGLNDCVEKRVEERTERGGPHEFAGMWRVVDYLRQVVGGPAL